MIKFRCKNCGQKLSVQDQHSGKRVKCPKCGSVGVVPDDSTKIEFQCKNCGHKISVPQIHAGKKGKCPKCKNIVVVPKAEDLSAVDSRTGSVKQPSPSPTGMVSFQCQMCDDNIQAPESSRGKLLECPNCGSYAEVPKKYAEVPKKEDISKEYAAKPQEQKLSSGLTSHVPAATSLVSDISAGQVFPATSVTAGSRPLGITIVVVLADILALLVLIGCILIIAGAVAVPSRAPAAVRATMVGVAIFGSAIALGILIVCHFLWKGANWARITFQVIWLADLALTVIAMFFSGVRPISVVRIVLTLIFVVVLNSASAKEYCGAG